MVEKIAWEKLSGLIPVIIQDYKNSEVLMLGFMNEESLKLSVTTGYTHFYSRSKQRIWKKGEQSGNIQKIVEMLLDCDRDTLLIKVEQKGVACHTGHQTCFFQKLEKESPVDCPSSFNSSPIYGAVDTLYPILLNKKQADSKTSYTALLYERGENAIAKKIVEEAAEFGFALKDKNKHDIIYEATDLLYHALVGLAYCEISPDLIRQELLRRFGISGIEEKKTRGI